MQQFFAGFIMKVLLLSTAASCPTNLLPSVPDSAYRKRTLPQARKGPYLNDVYTIFRILDPLPPCLHFGKIHKTKSTQPPLLRLHFVNPPPPLSVDVI